MVKRRDFLSYTGAIVADLALKEDIHSADDKIEKKINHSNEKKEVILCFDGSKSINMWNSTCDLSKRLSDISGEQTNFTYYINTAYLHSKLPGGSDIGFGGNSQEIDLRIKKIQSAINEGHEISSHAVRHKNGSNWSYQQWHDELSEFDEHMKVFFKDKNGEQYKSKGFRAPYLAHNDEMFSALSDLNYEYDVSIPAIDIKKKEKIICKGLPMYTKSNGKNVLGMDYNWHISEIEDVELEKMLEIEIKKNRALIISLHFSNWRHGQKSYYEVTKDFLYDKIKNESIKIISMEQHIRNLSKI